MNKYKKYGLYSLIFIIVFLVLFFWERRVVVSPVFPLNENKNDLIVPKGEVKIEPNKEKIITSKIDEDKNLIKASLVIDGNNKTYQTQIKENSTIFEVMNKLEREDDSFRFKYKEYKNMGVFVTEINGSLGKSGSYWIYYVNDLKPGVGISQYVLKDGDIIKWSQGGI